MTRLTTTRRSFLALPVVVWGVRLLGQTIATLAADPQRPKFHLLPARNWMNDPNGPIYFNGMYHMFFQYNPHGAVWGDMNWGHAMSPDMLRWHHLPIALTPTPASPDAYGCFSGSAIAIQERVYVVYTGTRETNDPALATIRDGSDKIQESQCLAWSDDPQLRRWIKDPSPIIPLPPPGLAITGFRDPSVWKQQDYYYMTVGSGIARVGGCVLLYRSRDLKHWEYLHVLTSGTWNGRKTPNPCDDGEMWECPELFGIDGGHILIYSTLGKVYWQSGRLDEKTLRFTAVKSGLLDFDAFYAPKTQLDARGQRILWGWIPERRPEAAMKAAGWSGMMSLPRVMHLRPDGELGLGFLAETASLRAGSIAPQATSEGTLLTLRRACGELLCSGVQSWTLDLVVDSGHGEVPEPLMTVTYLAEQHIVTVDGHALALGPADQPAIHAFVDGSVIEVILAERIGYTKRFYCDSGSAPNVIAKPTGKAATLRGFSVAAISGDRLTT